MKKFKYILPVFVFVATAGLIATESGAQTPDPVSNLTGSEGSEFVRLDWDDTQSTVNDYVIDYRNPNVPITGSIDLDGTNIVLGVDTLFTSEVEIGDILHISGQNGLVSAINSDTSLTLVNSLPDEPNDTTIEKTTKWVSYNDGINTDTNAVVKNLENDKTYEVRVRAKIPSNPGGKKAKSEVITAGQTITLTPNLEGYDIIITAGQSNSTGTALTAVTGGDMTPHQETWRIKQLAKYGDNAGQVAPAGDPLENYTFNNSPSLNMTFAREYRDTYLADKREILIVPTAANGTGFSSLPDNWDIGGTLSTDLISRSNLAYNSHANNNFVALLWHQGEEEVNLIKAGDTSVNQQYYENKWLDMINNYQTSITGFDINVPVLVGEMNPDWSNSPEGTEITNAHKNLVNLRPNVGFVSSIIPYELTTWDPVHFDEQSLVEFGSRYFAKFVEISQ